LVERLKKTRTVNRYGDGGPIIATYGSTTLSVLEALRAGDIEATVVQPIYLRPFPAWDLGGLSESHPIVVEQSSTGQFATLLSDKLGVRPAAEIRKYDGRAFDPEDLAAELVDAIG
jgi:2-oxoglutarate ferredoxin oxidoreductase subunit alpha